MHHHRSIQLQIQYVLLFDLRAKTKQFCHKHDRVSLVRFTISGSVLFVFFLMQEGSLSTLAKNPHQ